MKLKHKIWLIILIVIIGIQFVRINKMNPDSDPAVDFIQMENPPEQVAMMLKNACYDCHSHQTVYPWYTDVAPFSWIIGKHITEGREHLNFSVWGNVQADKRNHKLEEIMEEVKEGEMPIPGYTWLHRDAKLKDGDKKLLFNWLKSKM
jgi:hypothetical protein